MSAAILAFPGEVKRGRKRVARGVFSGCGRLSLAAFVGQGIEAPANVADIADAIVQERPTDDKMAYFLALAVYAVMPADQRDALMTQLRYAKLMSVRGTAESRALATELHAILAPAQPVFIRESDGRRFNVKGEEL